MNNTQQVNAVEDWQNDRNVHPLTCSGGGGAGDHYGEMVAEVWGNRVVMYCPECGYEQEPIPKYVLDRYANKRAQLFAEQELTLPQLLFALVKSQGGTVSVPFKTVMDMNHADENNLRIAYDEAQDAYVIGAITTLESEGLV